MVSQVPSELYKHQAQAAKAVAEHFGIPEEHVYTYGEVIDDPDEGIDITWAAMDGNVYGRYDVNTGVVIDDSDEGMDKYDVELG